MIGQTLAHYKVLEKIGSGGMGDVYLAEDTKLDRKVALKILPPELAESEERRARFKREAKALAALDHPNIVQVFSVEEAEGIHFITMQLVHGKTLTELLPKNGFPLNKFFEVAIPLADAVAAAHQEGITHRDLKPDNAMVGEDGRVKVLDFGLAKPTSGFVGGETESALPTAAKTAEGMIVGTLNYMSPEQAQGKTVDARSDIFSLGVVFYEMLTGRRPFGGDNPASVLSSIIKDEPPSLADIDSEFPRDLVKIVRRCLAKEPLRRFQSAIDLHNDLEELKQDVASGEVSAPVIRKTSRAPIVVLALVATLAVAGVIFLLLPERDPIPRLTNPVQITSAIGVEDYPTWSPDGQTLAYNSNQSGNWDIWVTQIGSGQHLNRTEESLGPEFFPSWSPDGREIAFSSSLDGGGIFIMSPLTGAPRKLVEATGSFGAYSPQWSRDGLDLALIRWEPPDSFVERMVLRTGKTSSLPLPGRWTRRIGLAWSPDGRFVAYVDIQAFRAQITQLWILNLESGEATPLTEGRSNDLSPSWAADGKALYYISNRGGTMDLWRQDLSEDAAPEGPPRAVTTGIGMRTAVFSPDGTKLAYSKGQWVANLWRVPILTDRVATWADAEQLTFDQAFVEFVDVSPDGERLVLSSNRAGNPDLWLMPDEGGEMTQLTTDPTPDWFPSFSPDGREIAFYAYRSGNRHIWVMPSGGGTARQITSGESEDYHPVWSPDGKELAFFSGRSGNLDVWAVPAEGGEARQMTKDTAGDSYVRWSPDGGWLLVASRRSGSRGLWLVPPLVESPFR